MSNIVIMPGGFHPFHAGHMSLYNAAKKAFPNSEVYVAATNSQAERPFPFQIKEKLAKVAGVEPGHFIQVKSPFQSQEIMQHFDPTKDTLVFVRSEKDRNESPKPGGTKKDGSPSYFQPLAGNEDNMQPFGKHAYFAYLPTIKFGPGISSATEIRNAWPKLDDKRKLAMVMSLYPATQKNPKLGQTVVKLLDAGMTDKLDEISFFKINQPAKPKPKAELGYNHLFKPKEQPGETPKYFNGWEEYEKQKNTQRNPMTEARIFNPQSRINLYYVSPKTGNNHVLAHNIPMSVIDKYLSMLANKGYDFNPQDIVAKPVDVSQYRRSGDPDLLEFAPSPGFGDDGDGEEKGDWNSFIETLTTELKKTGFQTSKDPAHNTPTGRLFFYVRKPPHDWDVVVVMQSTSNPGQVYYKVSRSSTMLKPGEDELIDHGVCPMTVAGAAWIQPRIEKAVGMDQGLNEFANDDFDDSPKYIPWHDFIEGVKGIVGKEFDVVENVVKSTIKARFVPHDSMEYGPTMLYSYYEARAGRNKGAVSTRGSIQIGHYYPNTSKLGTQNFITGFNLLKGHPFERHFDLTPENISKIASIILGNTEGAYKMQQQGVAEGSEEALDFATKAHAGQTRSGGDPYITHPMRVADHIKKYKKSHNLDALISAAYLHDTIEDTDTTQEVLHDLFGGLVASLVKELTSDPAQIKKMGKAQYLAHKMAAMSSYALVIKLADRLDNVKDITTAKTPEWRHKYATETNHILDYIEKTRALSGTHNKLISLIRAKLAEIDNPQEPVKEAEGTPEGVPHLTRELLSHIVQQVGTEGAHAIIKSLKWGDGAAKELLTLITQDLKNNIGMAESVKQRLDPKCWSGYKKQGTKMKGGVRVNNCVPVDEASSPAQQAAIAISKKKERGVKEAGITRRGILKGIAGAGALGAAGKASGIAGAFPTPSAQQQMYKAAADSNRAMAAQEVERQRRENAARAAKLAQNTQDVERLNKVNYHGKGAPEPTNAEWDGDSTFLYLDGVQYAHASRMPIIGDEPRDMKLITTKEGRQVYIWTRYRMKGDGGHYFYPAENPKTISEVLNTPTTNVVWDTSDPELVSAKFTASNGVPYSLSITAPFAGPDEISPYELFGVNVPDSVYDNSRFVEFSISHDGPKKIRGKQGIEGTGSAAEVFGIVTNALLQYTKKFKPAMLYFQAAEPSRQKLYAVIASRMVKQLPGWAVKQQDQAHFVLYNQRVLKKQGLAEFAPSNGDDDDGDYDLEFQVYQCNPQDQFEFIGGPLHQDNDLGRAHDFAYKLHMKHPDKAFMIWQPSVEHSRGGYGLPEEDEDLSENSDYLDEK